MTDFAFETNMKNLVKNLGQSLYSDPSVAIRELIQNANDACIYRLGREPASCPSPRITILARRGDRTLSVIDNGCGISFDQAKKHLGTLAESNKPAMREEIRQRDPALARQIVGSFGLGMLSTFVISKRVEIASQSFQSAERPIVWSYEKGATQYSLQRSTPTDRDAGTSVTLKLEPDSRFDRFLDDQELQDLVRKYAPFIRVPVFVGRSAFPVNQTVLPWDKDSLQDLDLKALIYGRYKTIPIDAFSFTTTPEGTNGGDTGGLCLRGVLYFPSTQFGYGDSGTVDIFGSGLFITSSTDILPDWARVLCGFIDSPDFDLTLSREDLVKSPSYLRLRNLLVTQVTNYFRRLCGDDPDEGPDPALFEILNIHDERIKRGAVGDAQGQGKFFALIRDFLPIPCGRRLITIPQYLSEAPKTQRTEVGKRILYYCARESVRSSVPEEIIFTSSRRKYFRCYNYYDKELVEQYAHRDDTVVALNITDAVAGLMEKPTSGVDYTNLLLIYERLGYRAKVMAYKPEYLMATILDLEQETVEGEVEDWYGETTDDQDELRRRTRDALSKGKVKTPLPKATLCLNDSHPTIRELASLALVRGDAEEMRSLCAQIYLLSLVQTMRTIDQYQHTLLSIQSDNIQQFMHQVLQASRVKDNARVEIEELKKQTAALSRELEERGRVGQTHARLPPSTMPMVAMFLDIRGFSKTCEQLIEKPLLVADFLKEFYSLIQKSVVDAGGSVDKFLGDGAMVRFSITSSGPDSPGVRAARCALRIAHEFRGLSNRHVMKWKGEALGHFEIGIGAGMAKGNVIAGIEDHEGRFLDTIVGHNVNFASRLCSFAKPGEILIAQTMKGDLEGQFILEDVMVEGMKGIAHVGEVYRLVAAKY